MRILIRRSQRFGLPRRAFVDLPDGVDTPAGNPSTQGLAWLTTATMYGGGSLEELSFLMIAVLERNGEGWRAFNFHDFLRMLVREADRIDWNSVRQEKPQLAMNRFTIVEMLRHLAAMTEDGRLGHFTRTRRFTRKKSHYYYFTPKLAVMLDELRH